MVLSSLCCGHSSENDITFNDATDNEISPLINHNKYTHNKHAVQNENNTLYFYFEYNKSVLYNKNEPLCYELYKYIYSLNFGLILSINFITKSLYVTNTNQLNYIKVIYKNINKKVIKYITGLNDGRIIVGFFNNISTYQPMNVSNIKNILNNNTMFYKVENKVPINYIFWVSKNIPINNPIENNIKINTPVDVDVHSISSNDNIGIDSPPSAPINIPVVNKGRIWTV